MTESIRIGIEYLQKLPHLTDFFSQNTGFTQLMAKSPDEENVFLKNFQKDIALHKSKISYEEAKKKNTFNVKSILGSFNVPSKGPSYMKKGLSSSNFFDTFLKKGQTGLQETSSTTSTLKKIYLAIKRQSDEKRYSRNISLQTASFFAPKKNVMGGLKESSVLPLKDKKISSKENIREFIAKKAYKTVEGQTDLQTDDLAKRIVESLFLVLNIGDIVGILKTNPQAQKKFSEGMTFAKESFKEDIAEQTLMRLGSQSTIDKNFLVENIEATAYLLENETYRNEILESVSTLESFMNSIGENNQTYVSYVVERAQALLSRNAFSETFLTNNSEFSSFVVGGEHLGHAYSLSQYIKAHPEMTEKEFDVNYLLFRYQISRLKKNLSEDVSLSENFFIHHKGILNTALSDSRFNEKIRENIDIIERFFSSASGRIEDKDMENATEAYLSDFDEREEEKAV